MQQLSHLQQHKQLVHARFRIIREVREFFWAKEFIEVDPPVLVAKAGQEPYLSAMELTIHDEQQHVYQAFLHTSPEYAMKKMLAAGYGNIFSLGKAFRDYESFNGIHNPEFTLLEWYRTDSTIKNLMDDVETLISYIVKTFSSKKDVLFRRVSMTELWKELLEIDLDQYLNKDSLYTLCIEKGYRAIQEESYEDLFYRIFLNEIEPQLKNMGVVMIHHYPAQMAALAKLSSKDPRYAERVEVYVDGIELANGFSELTDVVEQRKRFEEEQKLRRSLGKTVHPIDEEFIQAVDCLPECAGIALGIDRLVQFVLGEDVIDRLLPFPAHLLWEQEKK